MSFLLACCLAVLNGTAHASNRLALRSEYLKRHPAFNLASLRLCICYGAYHDDEGEAT